MGTLCVAKIQKKRKSIEKSYLDVLYGSRNMRNRFNILEILLLALKNMIQLYLSFEIGRFEVGGAGFSLKFNTFAIDLTMGIPTVNQ